MFDKEMGNVTSRIDDMREWFWWPTQREKYFGRETDRQTTRILDLPLSAVINTTILFKPLMCRKE